MKCTGLRNNNKQGVLTVELTDSACMEISGKGKNSEHRRTWQANSEHSRDIPLLNKLGLLYDLLLKK